MAIQKYQDSLGNLMPQTFSTMLARFFNDSVAGRGRVAFSPQIDAYETEKGYQIGVALPGFKQDDTEMDFHQGRLTISGERSFRNDQNERRYHVAGSSCGSFQRSFQLPDTVNPSQTEASRLRGRHLARNGAQRRAENHAPPNPGEGQRQPARQWTIIGTHRPANQRHTCAEQQRPVGHSQHRRHPTQWQIRRWQGPAGRQLSHVGRCGNGC